jgi:preprotein translocase subunit Sec63
MNNYTTEQKNDVIQLLKLEKDYYKVLDVTKTSTSEEIRRKYKEKALRFHPGKKLIFFIFCKKK